MTSARDIRAAQMINAVARKRMAERGVPMTDLAVRDPAVQIYESLIPRDFEGAYRVAKIFSNTEFVPKDYRGKPDNIVIAWQLGRELGLKEMQALQTIAVVNGRPLIFGDGFWALIKSHPLCEWTREDFDDATMTARCTVKRRGNDPVVRTFSKADAEKALLWTKDGPWKQYPKRMLMWRARTYAGRDAIPEAIKGFDVDIDGAARDAPRDMGDAVVEPESTPQIAMPQPIASVTAGLALARNAEEQIDKQTGEVKPPDDGPDLITEGAKSLINAKLAAKQLGEQFCSHYNIADPSELPRAKLNEALAWIDKHNSG